VVVTARNVRPMCPDEKGDPQSLRVKITVEKRKGCTRRTQGTRRISGNSQMNSQPTTYWDCDD